MKMAASNPTYSKDKEYSTINHEQDKKKSGDKANQNSGFTNNYSRLDVHVSLK